MTAPPGKYPRADALFAALEAASASRKPVKPTLRRFTWCRIHHELLRKPLWRLVARMSGASLPHVKLLVVELELYASENEQRGSLEGFNVSALAADWNLASDEQLARIYAALEHPDVGWIDQDFIVTFWARNPDAEQSARDREQARLRQQKARDRKKAKDEARAYPGKTGYPPSRVTGRDSVTSRTRADQIIKKTMAAEEEKSPDRGDALSLHSNSGDSVDERGIARQDARERADAEVWLAFDGKRIVAERCKIFPNRAGTEIARWRKELAEDVVTLAAMIHDADVMGLAGGKFTGGIRQRIIDHKYRREGTPLPMLRTIDNKRDVG